MRVALLLTASASVFGTSRPILVSNPRHVLDLKSEMLGAEADTGLRVLNG